MSKTSRPVPSKVLEAYFGQEEVLPISYGSGHIQDTFFVESKQGKYILQKINRHVFPDAKGVMENIIHVTTFLKEKLEKENRDVSREVMSVCPTRNGAFYYIDADGEYWRLYIFVDDTITYQLPDSKDVFYEAAKAFGDFQLHLGDYPADNLHETIKNFHHTPSRVLQLQEAIKGADGERLINAEKEIAFAKKRFDEAGVLVRQLEEGLLPLRVTHNDTKLNNVLIDKNTGKGLCVVDLDTVMPGLAAYDFGDAIRFGANKAEESEIDVNKVALDMELFEVYTKGYLEQTAQILTNEEIDSLPLGAKIITYETGLRFLADYLNNDVYFKISFPQENLIRARNQFALVKDMEEKWLLMQEAVNQYKK